VGDGGGGSRGKGKIVVNATDVDFSRGAREDFWVVRGFASCKGHEKTIRGNRSRGPYNQGMARVRGYGYRMIGEKGC